MTGILNYPRKVLSDTARLIKAVKALRGTPDGFVGTNGAGLAEASQLGTGSAVAGNVLHGDNTWSAAAAGSANGGQTTIAFASYLTEDSIAVAGQASLLAASAIVANVYANTDDIYAQDWLPPVIRSVIAGTGFTIVLRPRVGTFKGNVTLNWQWV